jgi:cytochrome c553
MQQAVSGLAPQTAVELASRLAALPAAAPDKASAPPPDIAVRGRPEHAVPGCLACHGEDRRNPAFPWLDGQPAPYLASQLRLFREAARGGGPYAGVMTSVAGGLSDEDIETLSVWFAAR